MLAFLKRRLQREDITQTTFVYCPTCGLEQCANNCFVSDTDLVRYRCVDCGTRTAWDFDAPVPLLMATEADR